MTKKEPFTFIWETRNATCILEERCSFRQTHGSIEESGADTVSVVFVFSAPGFENYMRCDSALPNAKVTPLVDVRYKPRSSLVRRPRSTALSRPDGEFHAPAVLPMRNDRFSIEKHSQTIHLRGSRHFDVRNRPHM